MHFVRISPLGGPGGLQPSDLTDEQLLGTDLMFLAAFTGIVIFIVIN